MRPIALNFFKIKPDVSARFPLSPERRPIRGKFPKVTALVTKLFDERCRFGHWRRDRRQCLHIRYFCRARVQQTLKFFWSDGPNDFSICWPHDGKLIACV